MYVFIKLSINSYQINSFSLICAMPMYNISTQLTYIFDRYTREYLIL